MLKPRLRKWMTRYLDPDHRQSRPPAAGVRHGWEALEDRTVPNAYTVTTALDSGVGSLRQAIADANAHANVGGPDVINFNVTLLGGSRRIVLTAPLPPVMDPVVIDGSTNPGFGGSPVIEINGRNAPPSPPTDGFVISAGASTVRGLSITGFSGVGIRLTTAGGNVVEGNYIGVQPDGAGQGNRTGGGVVNASNNRIGGLTPASRNVISSTVGGDGISIQQVGSSNNQILGNYIGTGADGLTPAGNGGNGISIRAGTGNQVGGTDPGAGNVIASNSGSGIEISGTLTSGTLIQGNLIGTDRTGTVRRGNTGAFGAGIMILDADGTVVGGATPAAGNVISGNTGPGVRIHKSVRGPSQNTVQGNRIGTDITGTLDLGNGSHGVWLSAADGTGNAVGGSSSGAGNVIAFNGGDGVFVESGTRNPVRLNSIFSNTGLGIDLAPNGATANDAGDPDTGANNLQNAPALASATASGATVGVVGSLSSSANTAFTLDFYASVSQDPTTFGEGQTYLGSASVTTDSGGTATFTVVLGAPSPPGGSSPRPRPTRRTTRPSSRRRLPSSGRISLPPVFLLPAAASPRGARAERWWGRSRRPTRTAGPPSPTPSSPGPGTPTTPRSRSTGAPSGPPRAPPSTSRRRRRTPSGSGRPTRAACGSRRPSPSPSPTSSRR